MIGLDTNVLVRHITQDDPINSPKATALLERQLSPDVPGFIGIVTIAEIAWVLQRAYGFSAAEIAEAIERILRMECAVVEHKQQVYAAMILLRENRGEFGDALIGLLARDAGCSHTVTFDRRASRLPGFKLLT